MTPAFRRLTAAFEAERLQASSDPGAHNPEQILVLEIAGSIADFGNAIRRIAGLEFLVEEAEDQLEPDEFSPLDAQGTPTRYERQLFLVASDAQAWQELLSLWGRFQRGETFARGLTPFARLFARLRDLRPWNDQDRLERSGALSVWANEFAGLGDQLVEFEIELWLRADQARRSAAVSEIRKDLEARGGTVVTEAILPEIDYHGVLGRVPARDLLEVAASHEVKWMQTDGVRFFHAVGQMAVPALTDDAQPERAPLPVTDLPVGAAKVALLDGYPLANHTHLTGRLVIDDPEDWSAIVPARRRAHGTGMASLVIHGDLNSRTTPLRQLVYVRPILRPDVDPNDDWIPGPVQESVPRDRLLIDFLYAAVARLFEGDAPAAPDVRVIVLALGDPAQQFDRFVSPVARLLDWLSSRYEVLFLVSSGNRREGITANPDITSAEAEELQHEVLTALNRQALGRRLLAPAESVNALTLGAAHDDATADFPASADIVDPFVSRDLPNFASAFGAGHRRSVKPDILLPGGRQFVRLEPEQDGAVPLSLVATDRAPGLKVASPGRTSGVLNSVVHMTGTSMATGIAGHHAGHLIEELSRLRQLYGSSMPGTEFDAVLVKAALVHTARWGEAQAAVDAVQEELGLRRSKDAVARAVGYGRAEPGLALRCDTHKVTVLAANRMSKDESHTYRLPLPPALSDSQARRVVTLTLAWITPINAFHRHYRRAALALTPDTDTSDFVGSRLEVDANGTRRGTVQHEVRQGRAAIEIVQGDALALQVACRASAGALDERVAYALLTTVEVAPQVGVDIYSEIRQALGVTIPVRPRT